MVKRVDGSNQSRMVIAKGGGVCGRDCDDRPGVRMGGGVFLQGPKKVLERRMEESRALRSPGGPDGRIRGSRRSQGRAVARKRCDGKAGPGMAEERGGPPEEEGRAELS